MKAKFNINCPLSLDEANEIQNMFSLYDIELYCGIDQYVITNYNMSKEYKLTVEYRNGQRYCYYGKTKKQAIAEFKRNFGNFRGFVKKEWEIIINN